MRSKILIGSIFAIILFSFSACSELSKVEKSSDFNRKLTYANQLYDKGKYSQAQQLYDQIKDIFKGTKYFEDLFYRMTYTYYYTKDYETAAFYFKNFVELFPNSPRATEMDFMQSYCYYQLSPRDELDQTNTTKAIASLQTFINMHPDAADKITEANKLISLCRKKLEQKEYREAQLYFDLGYFKSAAIYFTNLMRDYPDSDNSDQYKYMTIKAYYRYAANSVRQKQADRYAQVISSYLDFADHFPQSPYLKEAERFYTLSQTNLKSLQNEQSKEKSDQ